MVKVWNYEVFKRQDLGFENVVMELRSLGNLVANDLYPISSCVSRKREYAQFFVWEYMLRQKSRCNWLREGDQNSNLFHSYMKAMYKHNGISVPSQGGSLI